MYPREPGWKELGQELEEKAQKREIKEPVYEFYMVEDEYYIRSSHVKYGPFKTFDEAVSYSFTYL